MPSYEEYVQTYGAPDRDQVLSSILKYGTDDRSKWIDTPQPAAAAPQSPPTFAAQGTPVSAQPAVSKNQSYNGMSRETWRDQWMGGEGDLGFWKSKAQQMGAQWLADNGSIRTPWGEVYDGVEGLRSGIGKGAWTVHG